MFNFLKELFKKNSNPLQGWKKTIADATAPYSLVKDYHRHVNSLPVDFFVVMEVENNTPIRATLNFKDKKGGIHEISENLIPVAVYEPQLDRAVAYVEKAVERFIDLDIERLLEQNPEFYSETVEEIFEEMRQDTRKLKEQMQSDLAKLKDANKTNTNSKKKSAKPNSGKLSNNSKPKATKKQKGVVGVAEGLNATESSIQNKPARKKRAK